jgi:phage-related minor tail protein
VSAGEPYVVGERGQELFVPGSDGVILPAGVTAALMSLPGLMGGGGSTVVNNTSIVVNTNINSQGTAQLMSGAGRIARSIRGM